MSRNIVSAVISAVLAVAIASPPASAQSRGETQSQSPVERIIEEARSKNPALSARIDPLTGLPASVKGLLPSVDPDVMLSASRDASGKPSAEDVLKAAEAFFRTGEISAAFSTDNQRAKVVAVRARNDPDVPGQSIVHVEQRIDGIPVFGSSGRVVVGPSLAVSQLSATFSKVAVESTTPTVLQQRAIEVSRQRLRELLDTTRDGDRFARLKAGLDQAKATAQLVIYDPALMRTKNAPSGRPTRLSWLTSIDAFRFFVDAETGEVLFHFADQTWLIPRQVYDLEKGLLFPGIKLVDEVTGERREPLPTDASHAFENAGHVSTFYYQTFGRNGIRDDGMGERLPAYVQYGETLNAYWCSFETFDCPEAGAMVFGVATPGALDVVGHEMTHGIIFAEANLTYANESGAVNEALADIFGALIEFKVNEGYANWVMGEKLPGYTLTSAIRNLANPNMIDADGNSLFDRRRPYAQQNRGQPDHYSDYVSREDPICETTQDYFTGCVHFNSGIFNKFAFLIAEGGRHRGQVVKGIGRTKLGRIAYRALVAHLNPSSDLTQSAEAFGDACRELVFIGTAGFEDADCIRVREAQAAVGLAFAGS